jgi:hypothetical protein
MFDDGAAGGGSACNTAAVGSSVTPQPAKNQIHMTIPVKQEVIRFLSDISTFS